LAVRPLEEQYQWLTSDRDVSQPGADARKKLVSPAKGKPLRGAADFQSDINFYFYFEYEYFLANAPKRAIPVRPKSASGPASGTAEL
jgi:hypothetical protein